MRPGSTHALISHRCKGTYCPAENADAVGTISSSPMNQLKTLPDTVALEAAIAESRERPVLIFKHSRTCGISCEAFDELNAHLAEGVPGASYKLITVQSHRAVSDEAAALLGVRHETPQAILVRDGVPVWKASHFRITAVELKRVLS
jgi:bacillithiol system protein YtxJ